MRRTLVVLSLVALALSLFPAAAGAAKPSGATQSYIVVLDSGDPGKVAVGHSRRHNASVKHVYRHALRGYAARMSAQAAAAIARSPRVAYVEPDGAVTTAATQSNATWGLDRIDQRALPLSTTYSYEATGSGVTAYVIDTGIRRSHVDFSGRVSATAYYDAFGGSGGDCNGHGTHVAGTIGGETWGVAKDVNLVAVRVLDCNGSGSWSGVIAGLDWVAAHHGTGPAVANMSLGGGASSSVDAAVQRVIDDGVTVAVAAGNGNRAGRQQDACGYSPARVPDALTIGATTSSDVKTSWSNYGSCVDWFAPGSGITSAWTDNDTDTNTISGTSMATPHTAGAAALHLQASPSASAAQVRAALWDALTLGVVTSSSTANNHLLYVGGATVPADTTAPAAPSALEATAGDGQVSLAWTAPPDADVVGYNVYRGTATGVYGSTPINGSTLVTTTSYVDATAENGTTYYYAVSAEDGDGNESAKSPEDSATPAQSPDQTAPAAPTELAATAGDALVTLSWTANATDTDVAGYNVYRGTTSGLYDSTPVNGSSLVTSTSYPDANVTNGTPYYYVARAVDTSGNESGSSNEASATPQASTSTTASVTDSISATQFGGKFNTNHVDVAVAVKTEDGAHVPGAVVAVTITRTTSSGTSDFWSGTDTTGSSGVVLGFRNIPSGEYVATVTDVTPPSGYSWTAPEPRHATGWSK